MTTAKSAGFMSEMVIAEEVTKGTTPAITTGLRDYFTGDPGINPVQGTIDAGNVQLRHVPYHIPGSYHMAGNIPQIVTPNGHLGYWLGLAIGDPVDTGLGGTAYSHLYHPDDDLKTFSIWFRRGGNQQVVIPYGVVNTLELRQAPDDVLRSSVGFIGKTESANSDDFLTSAGYDVIKPFQNSDLNVTGPANAAQIHNSVVTINNGYDVDRGGVHGSRTYAAMVPGKRQITGSFDMWFDDDGDYKNFWGSSTATEPNECGVYDPIPLELEWNSCVEASAGHDFSLTVSLPEVMYQSISVNIEGRVKQTVNWAAQYSASDTLDIEATLINQVDAYP
jgi:Phage tail tube protein